jgi:hypothetical protein
MPGDRGLSTGSCALPERSPHVARVPAIRNAFVFLANKGSGFAGTFRADARTRTEDPFITSYGLLSLTASHLRSLVAPNPVDAR